MWKAGRRMWKVICIAGVFLAALNAEAIEFVQTEQFTSNEGEVLHEEIWISAQNVTIKGKTKDDLFAAGNLLDLSGAFQGDVWGYGDNVVADGTFDDHLRLAGRMVQISGTLHGSLTALGNTFWGTTIKIEPTASIAGNMLCIGKSVISEGTVNGDVRILAQRVTLSGQIAGDVSITAQDIVVLPGTVIDGNLSYTAPKELILSPSVIVGGELTRKREASPAKQILKPSLTGHFFFGFAALATGMVFISLFPHYSGGTFVLLRTSCGLCMLTGFGAFFLLPVAALLLLFTFIGIPLSILLLLFYLILLYLSKIVVALAVGSAILRRTEFSKRTAAAPLVLGLLIIYALTSFIVAELIVNILIIIFGLGSLLLALFKKPVLIIQTPDAVQPTN